MEPGFWQHLMDLEQGPPSLVKALNQYSLYCYFSHSRIYKSRNQGGQNGSCCSHYYSQKSTSMIFISPLNFMLFFQKSLFQREEFFWGDLGTTMILLSWMQRLPPGHFGLLRLLNQQTKKGFTILALVIVFDYQGELELLLHNEYFWNSGCSLGQFQYTCFVIIKSVGNYNYLQFKWTSNGLRLSGIRFGTMQGILISCRKEFCKRYEYFFLILIWICFIYSNKNFFFSSILSPYLI